MDYQLVGQRLKVVRLEKRLTQADLAQKANLSASFIGHIELGTRIPSLETICTICQILNYSLDALFYETNQPDKLQRAKDHLYMALHELEQTLP